jgi:PPIC-type PPIASE domain
LGTLLPTLKCLEQKKQRDAAQLLEQLKKAGANANASQMGDPFLLNYRFENVRTSEVTSQFGKEFSLKLSELSPGEWHGPIASGFGVHLVFVSERIDGKVPSLIDIRDDVHREWVNAQRLNVKEKFFQSLLKKYDVVVEAEQGVETQVKMAEGKK